MDSPAIEKVDSPTIKKEEDVVKPILFDCCDNEFQLILDVTNHNIEQLEDVFQVVRNVIYNELEYILICDRLNEIYKDYKKGDIQKIFQLTNNLYKSLGTIYTNYLEIKMFHNKDHEEYITAIERKIYNKLNILRCNYSDLQSIPLRSIPQ